MLVEGDTDLLDTLTKMVEIGTKNMEMVAGVVSDSQKLSMSNGCVKREP